MFRCAKLLIIYKNAHQQNIYSMFFNKYFSNSKFADGEDLFNRSELRFALIFAFLTAQNCELNAREIFGSKFSSFARAGVILLIHRLLQRQQMRVCKKNE